MKIIVLASGSKGNATYIETNTTKILIDAGISYTQIKARLDKHNILLSKLDAIFISHEHSDHVKELVSLLTKTKAKLYINKLSFDLLNMKKHNNLSNFDYVFINQDTKYYLNDLLIVPIELSHDAENTFGFLIKDTSSSNNSSFASITDTGIIPIRYVDILKTMRVILLESNHDIEMLQNSSRPQFLINRIASVKGHLSNYQAVEILKKLITNNLQCVILAHISQDTNCYDKVFDYFEECIPNHHFEIVVAKQYCETKVIEVK